MKIPHLIAVAALIALPPASAQEPDFTSYYPQAALQQGVGGVAAVECLVADDGRVNCEVTQEIPIGMGFGQAVLDMSRHWRMASQMRGGTPTSGGRIRRAVRFTPGPPPRVEDASNVQIIHWAERPTAQDFARLYPSGALEDNVSGRAVLDCVVNTEYRLDCELVSEEPPGRGFGEATLRIAEKFRMAERTPDGVATIGGRVRVPIRWNIAN